MFARTATLWCYNMCSRQVVEYCTITVFCGLKQPCLLNLLICLAFKQSPSFSASVANKISWFQLSTETLD